MAKLLVGDYVEIWYGHKQRPEMIGFGRLVKYNENDFPVVRFYDLNCETNEMGFDRENLIKITKKKFMKYMKDWKKDCKR